MEESADYLQHAISDIQTELSSQPQFRTVVKILQQYSFIPWFWLTFLIQC